MFNIVEFIKKVIPVFDKSDILTDLEVSLKHIETIQSVYSDLEGALKVTSITSPKNKQLIDTFYKQLREDKAGIKISRDKNIAHDTLLIFSAVKENGKYIQKELESAVNDVVVSNALTTLKAVLVRSVAHYYFITRYALKLINYLYVNEVMMSNKDLDKAYTLNKAQVEYVEKNMWVYARLLSVYGSTNKNFIDSLGKLDDVILNKTTIDEVAETRTSRLDIFDNLPAGFIGSPVYSIRLILAQWEADRYKEMKDTKKLLELRLLHYRMLKDQGESDIGVEKEISYLQKRITDLDYKIAKIEDDINAE